MSDISPSLLLVREKLYAKRMRDIVEYMRENRDWMIYVGEGELKDILRRIEDLAMQLDGVGHVK